MINNIIISLWCVFAPYILHPIFRKLYCYTKQIRNDGFRCYYWDCKEYLTCKYNKKCLNCTPHKVKRFDWLAFNCFVFELILAVIIIIVLCLLLRP